MFLFYIHFTIILDLMFYLKEQIKIDIFDLRTPQHDQEFDVETPPPCRVTWFKQIPEVELVWKFQKVTQRSILRWCGKEHPCKVTTWCMQFLRSYPIHKAAWPWVSLKVQRGHTKIILHFDVEYISTKIHDAGNLWRVITFTKCCRTTSHVPAQATIPLQPKGQRSKKKSFTI